MPAVCVTLPFCTIVLQNAFVRSPSEAGPLPLYARYARWAKPSDAASAAAGPEEVAAVPGPTPGSLTHSRHGVGCHGPRLSRTCVPNLDLTTGMQSHLVFADVL